MARSPRILIIDDEAGLRRTVGLLLAEEEYEVHTAENGEIGLEVAGRESPDLILCDIRMPKLDGIGFVERYVEDGGDALIVMMSAYGTVDTAIEAMRKGAYDYVSKPFNADEIILVVRKAIERERLRYEVRQLRARLGEVEGFERVVGRSDAVREVIDTANRVAAYPTTILISGESGTGKELIARAIHQASPRSSRPFIAVNCAAIPDSLLESELFGHEKGAFTGAERTHEGLVAQAEGGTLFLDEIGEFPVELQVKLLRVLQERTIRRVGGSSERAVDVRVLTATSRDLEQEVREGRFREDLYYRINVVHLHLPSLRARPEDIPELAHHFVAKHAGILGLEAERLPPDVLSALADYPWPGNVRELENVIERALVLSGGRPTVEDLPDFVRRGTARFEIRTDEDDLSVKRRLPTLEKALIERALERTGGNRTRAAEILELSVRALSYKIKDYGIEG